MSGAENGAERAENRLERSGERGSKNEVEREPSGSGGSSERERGAVSGLNLPLTSAPP